MKPFLWDKEKDRWLLVHRHITFQQVVDQINKGYVLDVIGHPNPMRYKNQRVFIIEWNGYAYVIPFVESEKEIFLKTIIPSRKATRQYLRRKP